MALSRPSGSLLPCWKLEATGTCLSPGLGVGGRQGTGPTLPLWCYEHVKHSIRQILILMVAEASA